MSEQMQKIHETIAECDREAALRGFSDTGFPRLWFSALSRVAGLELARPPRSKCVNLGDGSIPSPVTRDTSPAICELQRQNDELRAEITRLREERKPVAWCVQAAAGSMVYAGTLAPISAPVLIQCVDEAYARMLATVYGHRVLAIVEADAKEPNRE